MPPSATGAPLEQAADPSTAVLVERCLQGDQRAWDALVARYARLVHSVPVRHGLAPQAVDDVGQETFLALAQHLHAIDDPARLSGWLVTTARRFTWRALQRGRNESALEDGEIAADATGSQQLVSPLPTPGDLVEGWGRQEALYAGLQRLQERCRALLTLIFLDANEPSYADIAVRLGIPQGSIGPTRNRCLQQLRAILEGLGLHGAP